MLPALVEIGEQQRGMGQPLSKTIENRRQNVVCPWRPVERTMGDDDDVGAESLADGRVHRTQQRGHRRTHEKPCRPNLGKAALRQREGIHHFAAKSCLFQDGGGLHHRKIRVVRMVDEVSADVQGGLDEEDAQAHGLVHIAADCSITSDRATCTLAQTGTTGDHRLMTRKLSEDVVMYSRWRHVLLTALATSLLGCAGARDTSRKLEPVEPGTATSSELSAKPVETEATVATAAAPREEMRETTGTELSEAGTTQPKPDVQEPEAPSGPSPEQAGGPEGELPAGDLDGRGPPEGAEKGPPADEAPAETETAEDEPAETETAEDDEASGFPSWLEAFKGRATEAGVSEETLKVLDSVQPIARVIELDRRQPERRFTFQQYLARVVPDSRVEEGRRRYAEHEELLEAVGERYGVHPRFLVALWGIETDYGRNTGGFRVIAALATLAHDGRRAAFFETELLNALKIIDGGHITADKMLGSWAGALGQCQFMPSSFLSYAVDFTGDGRRDIWTSLPDVFASSANYLVRHGWQTGQTWGRRVSLPEGFDHSLVGLDTKKPLERWQELGVRRLGGGDLPSASFEGSLVQPGGSSGPTYLVYENYRTIMRWNRSHYFATAVGLLADRIAAE